MGIISCKSVRDYLAPYGYGTLPLPKADVRPLTLLGRQGDRLAPLGPLAVTFRPGNMALPETGRRRTAGLSGSQSKSIDAGIGINLLGEVIGALSGSSLGLKAAYKDAKTVEFEFGEVMENYIDVNALDSYLAATQIDPAVGPFLRQSLDRDEVYVITAAVDSRQISVKATSKSGNDLSLEVPVIQQAVGGKVTVGTASASNSVLTYTATDVPLVIGIQVVRLIYNGASYATMQLVKGGDTKPAAAHGADDGEGDLSHLVPKGELVL
jgi:hypothetical protein